MPGVDSRRVESVEVRGWGSGSRSGRDCEVSECVLVLVDVAVLTLGARSRAFISEVEMGVNGDCGSAVEAEGGICSRD
jgi:hypothetical protein